MYHVKRIVRVYKENDTDEAVTVAAADDDPSCFPMGLGVRPPGEADHVLCLLRRDTVLRRVPQIRSIPTEFPRRHDIFI